MSLRNSLGLLHSLIYIVRETIVDGLGFRTAIYSAGCNHRCHNCHNPKTWDINNGVLVHVQEVYESLDIVRNPILSGVTFTGGDPMFQAEAFCELAKMIKKLHGKDIWCYTGYLLEEIIRSRDAKYELLKHVDVLVDGKYVDELRDLTLAFRGSSNQRIIDVQESLKQVITMDVNITYLK